MTLTEIKALSDRELDAQLCEAMGWRGIYQSQFNGELCGLTPERAGYLDSMEERKWKQYVSRVPEYSKSLDTIAPLEAKTVAKFGWREYARFVAFILSQDDVVYPTIYVAVTASARHRAEACLYLWTQEEE